MAVDYDDNLCYIEEVDFLDAVGIKSIAADGDPPDGNAVHRLCQKVSGLVSEITGLTPPLSGVSPNSRQQLVKDATAIGLGFRYRLAIVQRSPTPANRKAVELLAPQVDAFFGKGAATGGLVKPGKGGFLSELRREVGGTDVASTDVSKGYTKRPEPPATVPTAKAAFSVRRPD